MHKNYLVIYSVHKILLKRNVAEPIQLFCVHLYFSRLVHIVTLNWARWLPNLVQITHTSWKHLDRSWHLFDYGLNAWLCDHVRKQSSHSHSVRMYWSHSSPTAIHPKTQRDCWPSVVYVSCSLLRMSLIFKLVVEHCFFCSCADIRQLLGREMGNGRSRHLHLCEIICTVSDHWIWCLLIVWR